MIFIFFDAFLLILITIVAIAVVRTHDLFAAVMLTGIYSLLMATNFFLLDAVDVALTEAAVGAGVSTVLSLSALALITSKEKVQRGSFRGLTLLVVATAGVAMLWIMLDAPEVGDPDSPVQKYLKAEYIAETAHSIHIPNVVTAVLGAFRGYDTFGETTVVLTAAIGVLLLLGRPGPRDGTEQRNDRMLRHHTIPQVTGRAVIPFIALYALYVQFHGEYSPGGGFQAGTLLAASVILFALLEGERSALRAVPEWLLAAMMSLGVLLYGGVGVLCMFLGGNFLDYSVLAHEPGHGQHLGLTLIELGVGISVSGVLLTIFHCFAARNA